MKVRLPFFLFILIQIAAPQSHAQTPVLSSNQIYGLNPLLYNGKVYTYFYAANTKGSQFLDGPEFVNGSVQIRGKNFSGILLNYDVYNQKVVLKYKTRMNNLMEIVISEAWLESFNLDGKYFEILSFPGIKSRIYQVIGQGRYRILYTWSKTYALDHTYGATNFAFSKPVRESYLQLGDKLMHYKSNRNFVALFGPENKSLLNKYLRKNKIKVRKSGQQVSLQLINYCNTLTDK